MVSPQSNLMLKRKIEKGFWCFQFHPYPFLVCPLPYRWSA